MLFHLKCDVDRAVYNAHLNNCLIYISSEKSFRNSYRLLIYTSLIRSSLARRPTVVRGVPHFFTHLFHSYFNNDKMAFLYREVYKFTCQNLQMLKQYHIRQITCAEDPMTRKRITIFTTQPHIYKSLTTKKQALLHGK